MTDPIILLVLLPLALILSLSVFADVGAFILSRLDRLGEHLNLRRSRQHPPGPPSGTEVRSGSSEDELPKLLFLVPAHHEESLIGRTIRSLRAQEYPESHREIVVVADNCVDRTADIARATGATVLERNAQDPKGKHHAIRWALERLDLDRFSAVVIVDADTIVDTDFARRLAGWAPLESRVIQARVEASNEDETWLTRMSAVLTRSRWDLALPLKEGGHLNCPLTGDGSVVGTAILKEYPWRVTTITEGWELYARFTLAKVESHYEPRARLYAQEARSLGQSRSQRERWTAGRLAVLRKYLPAILTTRRISLLQRLDLLAELSSIGPVSRSVLSLLGMAAAASVGTPFGYTVALIFASPILMTILYTGIAIHDHPEPVRTAAAFLHLPGYAFWRMAVGIRALGRAGTGAWVRTDRHDEP